MIYRPQPQAPSQIHRSMRQDGSILVQFALILGVLIAILGIVDVGYMYYAKRDLQRIADLAALEAVSGLDYGEGGSANCQLKGRNSIQDNWPAALAIDQANTAITCGNWERQS